MKPTIVKHVLQSALRRGFGDISELMPISEGEESRAYAFRQGEDRLILRVNRSADGFEKDAFAYRSFASAELPIPEVIAIGTLDDGNAWCVSRRAGGVTLQDLGPADLPPVLGPVARVMKAIAATDVSGVTGFGRFDPAGAGQDTSWRAFLEAVVDPSRYDWVAICAEIGPGKIEPWLDAVSGLADRCPERRCLVHGDFGSNNVLTDGARVTGVIDWSEALCGDPLYDVANILFWRPWLDCMEQQARYFERHHPELMAEADRLRCYQLRIGLEQIHQSALAGEREDVDWALARCARIAAI